MSLKAVAPGTCGELVQGTINDINVHITCPINIYSEISFEHKEQQEGYDIYPKHKEKAYQAICKTLEWAKASKFFDGSFRINSNIPSEKGMASSTADITAASLLTASLINKAITLKEIGKLALSIEPSDGLFFPGIVAFDHVKGQFFQSLGKAIPLKILVYDFGGQVNTVDFNNRTDLKEKNRTKEVDIKKAYQLVLEGLTKGEPQLIGQGATISSLANQNILHKPGLEDLVKLINSFNALGVNIAHSGTIAGILLSADFSEVAIDRIKHKISDEFYHLNFIGAYQLTDGGVYIKE